VATEIFGKSGRAILDALIAGERDGQVLAGLALGRLRKKIPALTEALVGHFDDHHGFLASMICDRIDTINEWSPRWMPASTPEIEPYRPAVELLDSIPGVDTRTAEVILAEIGTDMSRFTTAAHLASWAGVCPGNNKTGGKSKPARTRPGDRWLKAALGTAAMGAIRTKNSYTHALFRRIAVRRGGKRAQAAVAHSLLVAAWHVLTTNTNYHDLGDDYFTARDNPEHRRRRDCSNSTASSTASPSNPWWLDRVKTSHFRVNSGHPRQRTVTDFTCPDRRSPPKPVQ
jgi:transposase